MTAHCICKKVAKTTDHSPLPWKVYEGEDIYRGIESADGDSVVLFGGDDDEGGVRGDTPTQARLNAEFLVMAVNSHEALVMALVAAKDSILAGRSIAQTVAGINAALAVAGSTRVETTRALDIFL